MGVKSSPHRSREGTPLPVERSFPLRMGKLGKKGGAGDVWSREEVCGCGGSKWL